MHNSKQREDHLKALYALGESLGGAEAWVPTNRMAEHLGVKAPSVTNMVQVLHELGWAEHRPYRGARLSPAGRRIALALVRKHRLWETFLVERLGFGWEEVHDVAEQLEHIDSVKLVERLDAYLGRPTEDPHGDLIPDGKGRFAERPKRVEMHELDAGQGGRVAAVKTDEGGFLEQLTAHNVELGVVLSADQLAALPPSLAEGLMLEPISEREKNEDR